VNGAPVWGNAGMGQFGGKRMAAAGSDGANHWQPLNNA
jgi:hypothetical protein